MSNIQNSGATRTFFVTPEYVYDWCAIPGNVDDKIAIRCIRLAEDKYIRPIAGGVLYTTLINKINSGTLTGTYKFLMDRFVIPALCEYFQYEFSFYNTYKLKNKGLEVQTSETSQPVTDKQLNDMRAELFRSAQVYSDMIIRELQVNSTDYPEVSQAQADQIPPAANAYQSAIFVPNHVRNGKLFGKGFTTNLT